VARGKQQADDLGDAPQRGAHGQRRIGTRAAERLSMRISGDQPQRRRKRHLEARMHHRFRGQQQHHQCGDGHRAQSQNRPVEHDAEEHDGNHDERALRRDFRAGQHQIKRGHDQRADRRPFLDRHAIGDAGDQRQQRAHDEEYHAGHHRHVVAGNREHMPDAGDEHRVVEVGRDRVALAGDQRRRDRAYVAGQHRADARIDRIAHAFDECRGTQPPAGLGRRRNDFHRPVHEARGADALEIEIAGEIVTSGPQRLQRRIELRLRLDEGAGRWRHAAADGEPHALRLVDDAVALDALKPQHEAVGFLALVAHLDKARDRNAVGRKAQNGMGDQRRLERRDGKAHRDTETSEREHEGKWSTPQKNHGGSGRGSGAAGRPGGRLAISREIENDAGAEGDREPGKKPPGADLGGGPGAHARRRGEAKLRPYAVPAPLRTADRPSADAGAGAAAHARRRQL
jgi:hypothetical protein